MRRILVVLIKITQIMKLKKMENDTANFEESKDYSDKVSKLHCAHFFRELSEHERQRKDHKFLGIDNYIL